MSLFDEPREQQILRERARQLAQMPEPDAVGAQVEALLFRLNDETYAIDLRLLRSVQRPVGLAAAPCTPPHIAGMLNIRGEVMTVVALAAALGLGNASDAGHGQLLLAELPQGRVGLLVDEVIGIRSFAVNTLHRSFSGRESTRGIAEARIVLLDLEQLFSSDQFEVDEDVA